MARSLCFALLFVFAIVVQARISGFYGDNGLDQTVIHRTLSQKDRESMEHEILDFLGIPDRPHHHKHHPSLRKSAPQFLLDIRRRMMEEQEMEGGSSANATSRTIRSADDPDVEGQELIKNVIDESDTIMTFLNKQHHISEVRHERDRRVWFDVRKVSQEELQLMMAELRLYQRRNDFLLYNETTSDHHKHHHLRAEDGDKFMISVHNIVSISDDGRNHKELELLAAVNTSRHHTGWIEFNVTSALRQWIANDKANHGLYITAHPVNRPEHEIRLDELGLVIKGDEEYQPFMVGFFQGLELKMHAMRMQNRRTKRNASVRKKSELRHPFLDTNRVSNVPRSCQIQQLYVSFKELKWEDWIVAPAGYGAYYCSGECNFPLNSHMNATNHAIVQTLVHLLHPQKVPKPCCAPTKLTAISVLYFLDESNVNLKKYRNMVVKSCGCH